MDRYPGKRENFPFFLQACRREPAKSSGENGPIPLLPACKRTSVGFVRRNNLRINRKSAMIITSETRWSGNARREKLVVLTAQTDYERRTGKRHTRVSQRERTFRENVSWPRRKRSSSLAEHGRRSIIRSPEDKVDRNASGVGADDTRRSLRNELADGAKKDRDYF